MSTFSSRTANATKRIVVVLATLSIWPVAASAQLKVIVSGGFAGAYGQRLNCRTRRAISKLASRERQSRLQNNRLSLR
jgi:hypothetical protein